MERVVFRIGLILFTQPLFLRMCSSMNTRIPGLSRRALMSALGVSGFAVLLSACGEDAKPAGTSVESPSSSSAESADASSSASVSSSENPSPSSSVPQHYSGNSKAPDGEFRAADVYGPAQNVPKPKTEEGYTNASLDGMTKSVKAWTEWRNYGLQTGDFKEAYKFISKNFTDEQKTYDFDTRLYKKGGWIVGGDVHGYEFHGEPINHDGGKYKWKFFMAWPHLIYIEADGEHYKEVVNKDYENNWYMMTLHHDGNRWLIDSVEFLDMKGEKNEE